MLKDFIETVGLDQSFFYQFVFILGMYFLMKKLFLQTYYQNVKKRTQLTKGSFLKSKEMKDEITNLKEVYDKKAQRLNQDFQEIFAVAKDKAQKNFTQDKETLQKSQKAALKVKREQWLKQKQQAEQTLKKEMPSLVQSLVHKMIGKI